MIQTLFLKMAVILESRASLDVSTFRRDLKKLFSTTGSVIWTIGDEVASIIDYRLVINSFPPMLFLDYTCAGLEVSQEIELVAIPSNLKNGYYWNFICPISGRRCKKLHFIRGLFQHRTALPGVFYRQQVRGKCPLVRYMDEHDAIVAILKATEQPYFRENYAGKPTRRCLRMLRKAKKLIPRLKQAEKELLLMRQW